MGTCMLQCPKHPVCEAGGLFLKFCIKAAKILSMNTALSEFSDSCNSATHTLM